MENYKVTMDGDGNPHVVSTSGARISFAPADYESSVLAARVASMLRAHARREEFNLGRSNSYGHSTVEGEIGGGHIERRKELLALAHAAENEAQRWADYEAKLLDIATPPDLKAIRQMHPDGTVRSSMSEGPPTRALPLPASISQEIRLAIGYAVTNSEAYLKIANQARESLRERYEEEFDAMHDQAAAQMADALEED